MQGVTHPAMMNTWTLFRHVIVFWEAFDNPVFLREIEHPPLWYGLARRLAESKNASLGLSIGGAFLWFLMMFYFNSLLVLLILPVLALLVLLSLTLAPIVAEERAKRSWEPLLATPPGIEGVLLGKTGGAIWWLRHLLAVMVVVVGLMSIGVGFISLVLIPTEIGGGKTPIYLLCGAVTVLPVISSAVFIFDRVQQLVLTVATAMAISTSSTSVRGALSAAGAAAFITWMLDIGIAAALLAVQPGRHLLETETHWLALASLGPVAGYILELNLGQVVVFVGLTFLVREAAIRLLWRWSVHNARRL